MARRTIRNPLLLPELFYYILNYLDVPNPVEAGKEYRIRVHEPSRVARESLFALAQTCRATSEPSLDRLWRALGSLVPLIRCFAEVVDEDRAKTPPSFAEWATVHRYAVRVRELRIMEAPKALLSAYFLQCTISRPFYLLPNLRVLVWNPKPMKSFFTPLVGQLLVPGLVSLDIAGTVDTSRQFFESYALHCPNLKALRWKFGPGLCHYEMILHAVDAFSSSLLCLEKIESLELFAPFDHITLKHIILSPDFKFLGIMLDFVLSDMEQTDFTPADTPFPNIDTIKLEIWDLDFLISLLRPHQQMFRVVVFKFHSEGARPVVQPMHSCFTALATPQRINSLQSIDFSLHPDCSTEDAEAQVLEDVPMSYCLTYEILSPLASFRCLRKLEISVHNQISIDDDELATLARGWPSLQILYMDCRSGGWPWASAKYATLRGLLALIAACPDLYQLCLPIDARTVPIDASPDIRNTAIEYPEFFDSLISKPRLVADFFHKHFPSVKGVNTEWKPPLRGGDTAYLQECRRMWEEVEELL